MGREFDKSKFKERDEEHLKGVRKLIKKAKRYEPEELQISKAKPLTSDDLPDRPDKPTMPTLRLPNNVLRADKVAKPSGLEGKQLQYRTKTTGTKEMKKTYKNAPIKGAKSLKDFKQKAQGTYVKPVKPTLVTPRKNAFGKNSTQYAPGVSTGQKPSDTKPNPFGKNTSKNAPGASIGKGDSNLYKPSAKRRIRNQIRNADLDNKISNNELAKIRGISKRNNVSQKFVDRNIAKHGENKYGTKFTDPKSKQKPNPFGRETSTYAPGVSIRKKK